jgi:caffeoyl-CoA O-methyltransferase
MQMSRRKWVGTTLGGVGSALGVLALAPFAAHAQSGGGPEGGGRMFGGGRGPRGGTSDAAPPVPKHDAERVAFEVLDDIDRRQRYLNVAREDGRLLRVLTETIGAKHVVEVGTSTGYSGIWLALGLRATGGRLTTHEIDAERASIAQENFKRAGLAERVSVVRGDAHAELRKLAAPLDLVFIDAEKDGYPDYLETLAPLVRPGGLIVADNMSRPAPDPRYVRAVTTDPRYETVFLNMQGSGLGVTLKKY